MGRLLTSSESMCRKTVTIVVLPTPVLVGTSRRELFGGYAAAISIPQSYSGPSAGRCEAD